MKKIKISLDDFFYQALDKGEKDFSHTRLDRAGDLDRHVRYSELKYHLGENTSNTSQKYNFSDSELGGIYARGIKLPYAIFDRAILTNSNFKGAFLPGVSMKETNLSNSVLEKVNLVRANMEKAYATGVQFKEALLSWSSMEGTQLWFSKFKNANLQGTNLRDANLYRANMKRAILDEADITDAYMMETDLRHASMKEVKGIMSAKKLHTARIKHTRVDENTGGQIHQIQMDSGSWIKLMKQIFRGNVTILKRNEEQDETEEDKNIA